MGERCKCDCGCRYEDSTSRAIDNLNKIDKFGELTDFFKTFADDTRLKIIFILDKLEKMCVGDIAVSLDMTKSAVSHQLKFLKKYNLVRSEKQGREVFYSLADSHVKDVFEIGLEHIMEMTDEKRI